MRYCRGNKEKRKTVQRLIIKELMMASDNDIMKGWEIMFN